MIFKKYFYKIIKGSEFKKNILKLFSATIVSQSTSILSSLFLAYLFSAKDLGEFSVVLSLATITSIFITLRTEYPIITDSKKSNYSVLYSLATVIGLSILLLVSSILLFLLKINIKNINPNLPFIITIIGFSFGTIKVLNAYLVSKSKFTVIGYSKIINVISVLIFQLIFFVLKINRPLIYGLLIGTLINLSFLLYHSSKTIVIYNYKKIVNNIKPYFHKYRKIIGIGSLSDIINSIASNMIPFLLIIAFNTKIAGYYFFANKILSIPLQLISASSASVYFRKGSVYFKNKDFFKLKKLTQKLQFWNGLFMFFIVLGIFLFIDKLLHLFFNTKWDSSLKFIYILLPFFWVRSLFSPISNIMEILNKNIYGLYLNLFLICLNFIAVEYGNINNDILITIKIISITGIIGYLTINIAFLFKLKNISTNET